MDMKLTRRQFMKGAAAAGIALSLPLKFGVREAHAFYQSPGLQKFFQPLRSVGPGNIPVAVPDSSVLNANGALHYTIKIQQFFDQLHPTFAPNSTVLWGFQPTKFFGGGNQPPKHLGGIIVAQKGVPIQITFRNKLPSKSIIPVDTTLPGANQARNRAAVHIHGGLVPWISDGGPFDWWMPNGTHGMSFRNNEVLNPSAEPNEAEYYYPNDQSARLVWYHDHAFGITRTNAYSGVASAYIIRDSFEAGLRSMGLPDFIENGGYELPIVIQDKIFVGANIGSVDPTWGGLGLPTTTGSLWYPHVYEKNRWKLIGAGRNLPNPSVIAEMFGDTMLANGTVYPEVAVEPRPYRLRILNACNARFLNLQLYVENQQNGVPMAFPDGISLDASFNPVNDPGPDFLVLGNEAGFLANPVSIPSNIPFSIPQGNDPIPPLGFGGSLITGLAERWDVIVDFSQFYGKNIILYTDAPAPFPGGDPRNDYFPGSQALGNPVITNPGSGPNTRQIMRFNVNLSLNMLKPVVPLTITPATDLTPGIDPFLATPTSISDTGIVPYSVPSTITLGNNGQPRKLTLNEAFDAYGRLVQKVGTDMPVTPGKYGLAYLDPATETPADGDVEIWEIYNLTGDTHPMHFHLVNVQVLQRAQFDFTTPTFAPMLGTERPPDPTELGWKETVKMNPGEVITVIMKFKLPAVPFAVPASLRTGENEYVWHCHILEHEEHDMMRPLVVSGPNPTFGVNPEFNTVIGSVGGTVKYFVFGGTPPYTVTPSSGAPSWTPNAPFPSDDGTFSVTVVAGTPANDYNYEIKDSTTAVIATALLKVA